MVFEKFCITTRTKQERSEPFLEREGFGSFVFGGVPRRTTKASAAHGRAASAQAQCAADAYFLGRAPSATAVVATGGDTGALGHGAGRDIFIGHLKGCGPLVLARQGLGNRPIGGDLPPAKFLVLRELGGVCRQGHRIAGLHVQHSTGAAVHRGNTVGHCQLVLARLRGNRGAATGRAAAVFLRWFTEQQRNLEFAADTGYMPVSSAAFDAIADYPFEQQSYQRLYDVYNEMRLQNTPLSEPGIVGYHAKAKALYDSLRQRQKDYPQRLANGETLEALTEETWQLLCDNA